VLDNLRAAASGTATTTSSARANGSGNGGRIRGQGVRGAAPPASGGAGGLPALGGFLLPRSLGSALCNEAQ